MNKKSKRLSIITAVAAVMGTSSLTRADFSIFIGDASGNPTSSGAIVGANTVYDIIAVNQGSLNAAGTGPGVQNTGTRLNGFDATVTTFGTSPSTALVVYFQDYDFDGVPDANIFGNNATPPSSPPLDYYFNNTAGPIGTFMHEGGSSIADVVANGVDDFKNNPITPINGYETNPGGSAKNHTTKQSVDPRYSNLHSLEIAETGTDNASSAFGGAYFAQIVVPNGTQGTFTGQIGGDVGGPQSFTIRFPIEVHGPIIYLGAATPTNTGGKITNGAAGTTANPQGTYTPLGAPTNTLTVSGAANSYAPGFIRHMTAGTTAGYTSINGFSSGDLEIYLLHLSSSSTDASLVADINNPAAGNAGVVASLASADPTLANLGGIAWDIELKFANPGVNQNGNFGFNLTNDTNASGITVTDIAAVPEPATAGLLMVGTLGILARRHRAAGKS